MTPYNELSNACAHFGVTIDGIVDDVFETIRNTPVTEGFPPTPLKLKRPSVENNAIKLISGLYRYKDTLHTQQMIKAPILESIADHDEHQLFSTRLKKAIAEVTKKETRCIVTGKLLNASIHTKKLHKLTQKDYKMLGWTNGVGRSTLMQLLVFKSFISLKGTAPKVDKDKQLLNQVEAELHRPEFKRKLKQLLLKSER